MEFKYYPVFGLPDIKKQIETQPETVKNRQQKIEESNLRSSIRIQSLEINNFKGVRHGYIELYSVGRNQFLTDKSNILALYGQNGSGKTSVVQVLYLLKWAMMGKELPDEVGHLITQGAETTEIKTVFEYKRKGEDIVEYITYSFSLRPMYYEDEDQTETVGICDEVLSICKRDSTGKLVEKTRKLFDTNSNNKVLNTSVVEVDVHNVNDPDKTWKERFQIDDSWQCFRGNREDAIRCGASVLFYQDLEEIEIVDFGGTCGEVYALYPNRYAYLGLLKRYAEKYLHVAGANLFNAFSKNATPLYLRSGYVETCQGDSVTIRQAVYLAKCLMPLNRVLSAVIPGLKVEIKATFEPKKLKELTDLVNQIDPDELPDDDSGKQASAIIGSIDEHKEKASEIAAELNSIISDVANWDEEDLSEIEKGNLLSIFKDDYEHAFKIEFFTRRGDTVTPIADESEGIKHIIYELDLFIAAYNDPSMTVAIDEFDAGVFEYLLGEMLKIFERHGKGQLIFTSHNLRPLEVLDRSFVCFTTTNPENRYLRMKYINQTNNLRDVYYRQILVGEQDEDLYDYVDSFELKDALDRAGEDNA